MAYSKVGYSNSLGSWNVLKVNDDGSINVSTIVGSVILETSDVQIGAVEIKDDDTGSRLDILSTGTPGKYIGVFPVGSVVLNTSTANVGSVNIGPGASNIGSAYISNGTIVLGAGAATIGSVITTVSATLGSTFLIDQTTGSALDVVKAGTASVNSLVVQGNTGGIPLPVSLTASGSNIGSVHVTNVEAVTSLVAGSVQLQAGTASIGSVSNNDVGVYCTTGSVFTLTDVPSDVATWIDGYLGSNLQWVGIAYTGYTGSITAMVITK